jgi:hydrogenase maturation protease
MRACSTRLFGVSMGSCDSADDVRQVLILGLGNPLLGDEGIGMRIIEELEGQRLPDDVMVLQGGTAGLDLLGLMEGYRRVIVIDAADMGRPSGHVTRFTPSDVRFKTADALLSPHQMGVGEVLALAETLDLPLPELVIIGIQPGRIEAGAGLSPEVENAIPTIIEIVLDELIGAGIILAPV